jgi:hypothetical protein
MLGRLSGGLSPLVHIATPSSSGKKHKRNSPNRAWEAERVRQGDVQPGAYFGESAEGLNSFCPFNLYDPIACCPSGEMSQSAKAVAGAKFARACF